MRPVNEPCTVLDCPKPRRGPYCSMHNARVARHGSIDLPPRPVPSRLNSNGYRIVPASGHSVAHKDGNAYEHRVVLYDAIGPGVHPCHWCGKRISWGDDLHTDHVDHNPQNNNRSNLVQSCAPCNVRRNRRWAVKQTHCRPAGHEMTPENTYLVPATGNRQCRACARTRKTEHKAKTRRTGPCHGCGHSGLERGTSTRYCTSCASDPMRAVSRVPEHCTQGHALSVENLTFVRANSQSDRLRWRCVLCTRHRGYAAFQRRRTEQRLVAEAAQ